jgi:hypothetical protein
MMRSLGRLRVEVNCGVCAHPFGIARAKETGAP